MNQDKFIGVKLNRQNIDIYIARTSIFRSLSKNCRSFTGSLLDVGCGKMAYREFILGNSMVRKYTGLDIESALDYGGPKPDVTWDGIKMPFEDDSFDCAMATEVFEHCPDPEIIMNEIFRVLKPGGKLFFTVPFLWPLHEIPHDEYRYTPFALDRLLTRSGFNEVDIKALGGWDASLAQMLGLYAKRRGIPTPFLRYSFSMLAIPIIRLLLFMDKRPSNFDGGYMITGLSGIASKII